jgi:hypothetical protein
MQRLYMMGVGLGFASGPWPKLRVTIFDRFFIPNRCHTRYKPVRSAAYMTQYDDIFYNIASNVTLDINRRAALVT